MSKMAINEHQNINKTTISYRAGTIRRLSPTIVAEHIRFLESILNHRKSILFTTITTAKMSCSVHNLNCNSNAWQLAFEVSRFCEPIKPL